MGSQDRTLGGRLDRAELAEVVARCREDHERCIAERARIEERKTAARRRLYWTERLRKGARS